MRRTFLLPLLVLPALAGCPEPPLPTCDMGTWAFGETASVTSVSSQGRLLVVVWSDEPFTGAGNGRSVRAGLGQFDALVQFKDGHPLQLKLTTTDGKAWTVAVNGTEYRLEDGAVFLVRTRGAAVPVTQIKHDLSGRAAGPGTWEQLAAESLDIQAFLAPAGGKK